MDYNSAAAAYTINAIAALVRRNGVHDYTKNAVNGSQAASLCGVAVTWFATGEITLAARDVHARMEGNAVTFTRGTIELLQVWHKMLADLDSLVGKRPA